MTDEAGRERNFREMCYEVAWKAWEGMSNNYGE
jgi:hypothetical protein